MKEEGMEEERFEPSPIERALAAFMEGRLTNGDRAAGTAAILLARHLDGGDACVDLEALAEEDLRILAYRGFEDPAAWRREIEASPLVGRPRPGPPPSSNPGETGDPAGTPGDDYRPMILDRNRLYFQKYFEYEVFVARGITSLLHAPRREMSRRTAELFCSLFAPGPGPRAGSPGTDWQAVAAFAAFRNPFTIISGGPGTGKTFTLVKIIALLLHEGIEEQGRDPRIAVAAPTGKAASRMNEAIRQATAALRGLPPRVRERMAELQGQTLHRLLGYHPRARRFRHGRENPLDLDALFIDEASMIDLELMAAVLAALDPDTQLVLLGDKDQLFSVEAGAVLGDLGRVAGEIALSPGLVEGFNRLGLSSLPGPSSASLPVPPVLADTVVVLRRNYRAGGASGLVALIEAVNRGEPGIPGRIKGGTFPGIGWIDCRTPRELEEVIERSIAPKYARYTTERNPRAAMEALFSLSVLSPLKGTAFGVRALNALIEAAMRRQGWIRDRGALFYHDRPVMIIRNDYRLELFNGEVGLIRDLTPGTGEGKEYRALFPASQGRVPAKEEVRIHGDEDRAVPGVRGLPPALLPEHETAFAMTVHKSQGSEFEEIVLVLPPEDSPLLTRELLYTALSRSRDGATIVGTEEIFERAVSRRTRRASGLARRILDACGAG